ncbi:hypothetical protein HK100_008178 [Physocladia obscura]|uniref:Uncharacterized protein n=1 Tax=Physocladia obscura TaxID=109957 RepID=A0AAD5SN56_9FUNG|nr:hypothetical protein HK100_008178 [Physocladia obscura]
MPKRFVNVNRFDTNTSINITDMKDLSELQQAAKKAFSIDTDHDQIELWAGDTVITTWDQFNSLADGYFVESVLSLDIRTTPPSSAAVSSSNFTNSVDPSTLHLNSSAAKMLIYPSLSSVVSSTHSFFPLVAVNSSCCVPVGYN